MNARNQTLRNNKEAQLSLFPEAKSEHVKLDTLYQYSLIISLPEQVKAKLKLLKHELNCSINLSNYNMHSVPHISLISFHAMRQVNERFIEAVQNVFLNDKPFSLKLKGFNYIEHGASSNTIYVNIENSTEIEKAHIQLAALLRLPLKAFAPHLAIAQAIPRASFEKAYALVQKKSFDAEFNCCHLQILERKICNGVVSNYEVMKDIRIV